MVATRQKYKGHMRICREMGKIYVYIVIFLAGAVDSAAKTAEVRLHETFKESNARLVHYTIATTELSFLYSSLFFCLFFPKL